MRTRIFTLMMAFLVMAGNAVWGQETTTTPETETIDGKTFYLLDSKEDLKWFQEHVSESEANASACAKLMDDIDLNNEEWTPIGYYQSGTGGGTLSYTGTFDGNGKTISGLKPGTPEYHPALKYTGLFSIIGDVKIDLTNMKQPVKYITGGIVKDLTVEGSTVSISEENFEMGGICGIICVNIKKNTK